MYNTGSLQIITILGYFSYHLCKVWFVQTVWIFAHFQTIWTLNFIVVSALKYSYLYLLNKLIHYRMTGNFENLTNSQFSSIDELNVDKCLDSSKSYTCSVKVWRIKYWRYQNPSNSSNFSFVKISCCTVL